MLNLYLLNGMWYINTFDLILTLLKLHSILDLHGTPSGCWATYAAILRSVYLEKKVWKKHIRTFGTKTIDKNIIKAQYLSWACSGSPSKRGQLTPFTGNCPFHILEIHKSVWEEHLFPNQNEAAKIRNSFENRSETVLPPCFSKMGQTLMLQASLAEKKAQ